MALVRYENCQDCNGYGYFSCKDCICSNCLGKGKISCVICNEGYVPCGFCNSSGKTSKKFLFWTSTEDCPKCNGLRKLPCIKCNKSGYIICTQCAGTGRISSCTACSGTQKVKCKACAATGKIENQEYISWINSLNSLPVERLKYETEKRQREIQQHQIKISRLNDEQNALWDEYRYDQENNPDYFIHGGWSPDNSGKDREIKEIERIIEGINEEISVIDKLINTKWR